MREISDKQEKYVAKYLGAKKVVNSGATVFKKGDVEDAFSLFECKTKMKESKSFSIKKDEIDKLQEEVLARGKEFGIYVFNFGDYKDNYAVLRLSDFQDLYEAYKELSENLYEIYNKLDELKEMEK